jgi:hypothetical protein
MGNEQDGSLNVGSNLNVGSKWVANRLPRLDQALS